MIRKDNGRNNSLFLSCQMGLLDGAFFMIKHTPLPNGNQPILSPFCPMGVADMLEQCQQISKANFGVLDSSKKCTLGHFSVHKIAPAFVFWKNRGYYIFFRDLLTFNLITDKESTFAFITHKAFQRSSLQCFNPFIFRQ